MHTKKVEVLEAMAKIPELRDLDLPIERMPDEAEFKRDINYQFENLQIDFDELFSENWEVPELPKSIVSEAELAPVRPPCKSRHTTIRIPGTVLTALYAKADELGIGYQTLIIRTLRSAIASW